MISEQASKFLRSVPGQRYISFMSKTKSETLKQYLASAASKTVNSWQVDLWRASEKQVSK